MFASRLLKVWVDSWKVNTVACSIQMDEYMKYRLPFDEEGYIRWYSAVKQIQVVLLTMCACNINWSRCYLSYNPTAPASGNFVSDKLSLVLTNCRQAYSNKCCLCSPSLFLTFMFRVSMQPMFTHPAKYKRHVFRQLPPTSLIEHCIQTPILLKSINFTR